MEIEEKIKSYYQKNRERLLEKQKEYYKNNKEKIKEYEKANRLKRREYQKKYDKNNPEIRKKYYKKNKEKIKQRYIENKESILDKQKEYRKKNKNNLLIKEKARRLEYYKNNLNYRIQKILRSRFFIALKDYEKSSSVLNLIGCSVDDLKTHIESLFKEGMTWDNHGIHGWHIDHIKPCASFDLTDPDQQKECFHYSNLQPLWAKDNLIKGSRF